MKLLSQLAPLTGLFTFAIVGSATTTLTTLMASPASGPVVPLLTYKAARTAQPNEDYPRVDEACTALVLPEPGQNLVSTLTEYTTTETTTKSVNCGPCTKASLAPYPYMGVLPIVKYETTVTALGPFTTTELECVPEYTPNASVEAWIHADELPDELFSDWDYWTGNAVDRKEVAKAKAEKQKNKTSWADRHPNGKDPKADDHFYNDFEDDVGDGVGLGMGLDDGLDAELDTNVDDGFDEDLDGPDDSPGDSPGDELYDELDAGLGVALPGANVAWQPPEPTLITKSDPWPPAITTYTDFPRGVSVASCVYNYNLFPSRLGKVRNVYTSTKTSTAFKDCGHCALVWQTAPYPFKVKPLPTTKTRRGKTTVTAMACKPTAKPATED